MKKITLVFICISAFVVSCTFEKADPLPVGCATTMFYTADIKPIIELKCVNTSCHIAGGTGTGDFTVFSELKTKVENGSFRNRAFVLKDMPEGGPPLSSDDLSKLNCWIQQGAPNN